MATHEMAETGERIAASLEHSLSSLVHNAARELYEANSSEALNPLQATTEAFIEYWGLIDSLEEVDFGEVDSDTAFASGAVQVLRVMSQQPTEQPDSEPDEVAVFARRAKELVDTFDFGTALHELAIFQNQHSAEPDALVKRYLDGARYAARTVWGAQRAVLVRDAEVTYNKQNPTAEENEAVCLAYIATSGVKIGQKITMLGTEIAALPDQLWLRGSIKHDETSGKLKLTAQGVQEVKKVFVKPAEQTTKTESETPQKPNRIAGAIGAVVAGGGMFALSFVGEPPEQLSSNPVLNVSLRVVAAAMFGVIGYDAGVGHVKHDVKAAYRTLFPKAEQE